MPFPSKLKDLCTPSAVYFVISILGLAILSLQNISNRDLYTIGTFSCKVPSTLLVFTLKLIYILFWTWILNLICRDNHSGIAWFLVLLPFILLFVIIGLLMINQ
jgi:hypothetical protein